MLSMIFYLFILGISCYCLAKSRNLQFIKVPLAYAYIWVLKKRLLPMFHFDPESTDPAKIGVIPLKNAWIRESPNEIPPNIHGSDSLRICGINKEGNFLFVSLVRRHGRCVEINVHLRLSNGEEYQHPCHPDTLVYNTNGTTFSGGGLTFEILEPLRQWRVIFRGYLRQMDKNDDSGENEELMVQFNFLWHPIHNYVEFPYDYNTKYLANSLAAVDWFQDFSVPRILQTEEWHGQFGQLYGLLNIEGKDELELVLRGLKTRRNGALNWTNIKQTLSFEGLLHNGTNFHLFVDQNGAKSYLYGYVCPPCNMTVKHITKFHFDIDTLINVLSELSADELSKNELIFETGKDLYKLKLKSGDFEFNTYGGEEWKCKVLLNHLEITLNGKPGVGVVEQVKPSGTFCKLQQRISLPQLREPDIQNCSKLVLSFKDRECQSSAIVGGKGSSLALMSTLIDTPEMFSVPKGVCITKTAFARHLQENHDLEVLIDRLTEMAWNRIPGSIQDECNHLTKVVAKSELLSSLKKQLKQKLSETFGEEFDNKRFAVRSSAIGEDGEEMSAAGQNETFLGVKGFDQICDALLKCWASQFAFRSVEYKRQNGQLFNGGMGVVVQEMVNSDIAGVLFTRDPMTGSAAKMFITANYGLGESVVSATADPDTIIMKRTWDDILTVASEQIGKKSMMISMSAILNEYQEEDSGTVETEILGDQASKCTVDTELAITLGKIAIYLERLYGSARDIEWAVKGKCIFLLQSRPVTTENAMLDFEILHEFDTILRTDNERYTTANIGEVMPGAMTPLSMTSSMRGQNLLMQKEMSWKIATYRFDPTVSDFFGCFYGHAMFDRLAQKAWSLEKKKGTVGKACEIGIYGRVLDDDDVVEQALERYIAAPFMQHLSLMKLGIRGAIFWKNRLKVMEEEFWNYRLQSARCTTAYEAYTKIGSLFRDNLKAFMSHMEVTMSSTIWNQVVLNMISPDLENFSTSQYSDFADIIGSGNGAESGDVPFSLRELAEAISKEIEPDIFGKMPLQEALEWLQQNKTVSGEKFKEFLSRHGHRGLKEFDLGCVTWARKPESVIEVLQGMICNLSAYKTAPADKSDAVIDSVKSKLSPIKKKLFPWVTRQCRQAVCGREKAKSFLIKAFDNTRREYHNLANLMVKEGFIPDPELIFFFTHYEIGIVIQTRSPTVIRRANHRRRLYPLMDRLKFPEMVDGFPKPIDENDLSHFESVTQVTGYPVSQGVIKGSARVVASFHEVNTIKPGEILITYSTDIGWSPYFPMLSGVVTEIGGLISHGAVVAREFGLPCIVGAQNATKIFKTGDTVLLNAAKGVISKVE